MGAGPWGRWLPARVQKCRIAQETNLVNLHTSKSIRLCPADDRHGAVDLRKARLQRFRAFSAFAMNQAHIRFFCVAGRCFSSHSRLTSGRRPGSSPRSRPKIRAMATCCSGVQGRPRRCPRGVTGVLLKEWVLEAVGTLAKETEVRRRPGLDIKSTKNTSSWRFDLLPGRTKRPRASGYFGASTPVRPCEKN